MAKQFWDSITRIGINEALDSRESRRVSYANYIALLVIFYLSVRISLSLENFSYCIKLFSAGLPAIACLFLNKFRYYKTARIVLLTFYCSVTTFFSYAYLGGLDGAYVVLFVFVPLPFMFFDLKQKQYLISMLGLVVFCFIVLFALHYSYPLPVTVNLNMDIVRVSTTTMTIVLLLMITWYFSSSNTKAEEMLTIEKSKLVTVNLELQQALGDVKVLSGLVPICSLCKKIRDDKGFWNHLESYIEEHSDASFSHGMCHECSDKLYGDEDWYLEMKKE